MRVDVVLTAEAAAGAPFAGATVLVVDVLRASTTIIAAVRSGCVAVVPVAEPAEAHRLAAAVAPGQAVLAGERRGEPITGFDLGNSPLDVTPERVGGKTLIMTTSNGTRALLAARAAARVGVAALVNVSAATAWAVEGGLDVTVLCAGERGGISLEDRVCAGLLVAGIVREVAAATVAEAAAEAAAVARGYGKDVGRIAEDSSWARHLIRRGRGSDVAACLTLDTTTVVPVYRRDVDKIVAGPR